MIEPSFSPREREVVQLLISGKTQKEISTALGISPKTVNTFLSNAKARVKARTTEQLIAIWTAGFAVVAE